MAIRDFFRKNTPEETQEERYILSIDGGGMRGIIPAILLNKIAMLLEEQGDRRPLYAHFDLIAGTSTGGLLALALAAPAEKTKLTLDGRFISYIYDQNELTVTDKLLRRKASQTLMGTLPFGIQVSALERLYVNHGKEIFPKTQGRLFSQIFTDKYDSEPLERYLKDTFGDIALKDAVVPLMVMAYDVANGRPFPLSSRDSHGYLFWEAGRATSAAPTYFKPAYLYDRQDECMQTLIDGGIIANNPALFAYSEAKKLYPDAKKFHILSLSTASSDFGFTISGAGSGVIGWIDPAKGTPIQKIYAGSQLQAADAIASVIPDLCYTRVHGTLGEQVKLDATGTSALAIMKEKALEIYRDNEEGILSFAEKLKARKLFDQLTLGPKEIDQLPAPTIVERAKEEPPMQSPELSSYYSFLSRYNIQEDDGKQEGVQT
ncbi:patatin-like phospholipase family protein [Sphaerochaeta sp. PS]|uniref:patatin-like phospholipase family protein n=1 Tax=Sphaerochaeta sp. PS TaxID=3076336 RepID=UPI0028A4BA3F|nr:patatin-like phospholipase family protein [Sphaerochaeta sp. PS]MDT4762292.1 patatin-like phospholipase family protein [Sphaerochaeta sp. PS]